MWSHEDEREAVLRRMGTEQLADRLNLHRERPPAERERPLAAVGASELENVVDEAREPLRLGRDGPIVLGPLLLAGNEPVAEHLSVHADGGEGRLQLVGDRSHEAAPLLREAQRNGHHAVEREEPCACGQHEEHGELEDGGGAPGAAERRQGELRLEAVEGLGEAVDDAAGRSHRPVHRPERDLGSLERPGSHRAASQPLAERTGIEDEPLAMTAVAGEHRSNEEQRAVVEPVSEEGIDGEARARRFAEAFRANGLLGDGRRGGVAPLRLGGSGGRLRSEHHLVLLRALGAGLGSTVERLQRVVDRSGRRRRGRLA